MRSEADSSKFPFSRTPFRAYFPLGLCAVATRDVPVLSEMSFDDRL